VSETQDTIGGFRLGMVHHADCLDAMRQIPDGCVDAVVTDPPYDAKTHKGARYSARGTESKIAFDPLGDVGVAVREMLRVARGWVVCFCALEMFGAYRDASGDSWVRAGFWRRPDGCPQFTGDRPGQPGEGVAIMHRPGRKVWNGGGKHGFWTCGVERDDRKHETQKPVGLMVDIVRDFTAPGSLVLDCYSGYGTTAVACHRTGRRFIGFELNPEWVALSNRRIAAEHERLGEVRPDTAKPNQQIGLPTGGGGT
jgi:site-specific DNA-methyltransferase (adenine-specific)